MSKITLTALRWAPPFAQGLVRDTRVRWALEELGLPYEVKLVDQEERKTERFRKLQPFGKVPVYEEDGLVLFESGAILLHIAEKSEVLMPKDPHARARAIAWMFAALNSLEPFVQNLADVDLFNADKDWAKPRRPVVEEALRQRLQDISKWLEGRQYLEDDRFTVADLLMTCVLRIPRHTTMVKDLPVLESYRLRCEARPAFKKSLADHMATFAVNA